jgi:hypothetical protein
MYPLNWLIVEGAKCSLIPGFVRFTSLITEIRTPVLLTIHILSPTLQFQRNSTEMQTGALLKSVPHIPSPTLQFQRSSEIRFREPRGLPGFVKGMLKILVGFSDMAVLTTFRWPLGRLDRPQPTLIKSAEEPSKCSACGHVRNIPSSGSK